jgi:hypothetical protein
MSEAKKFQSTAKAHTTGRRDGFTCALLLAWAGHWHGWYGRTSV